MSVQETVTEIIGKLSLSDMLSTSPPFCTDYIIRKFAMTFVDNNHELIKKAFAYDGDDFTGEESAYIIDVTEGLIGAVIEEDWASSDESQRIADGLMAGIEHCYRDPIMQLDGFHCLQLIRRFPLWNWNENVYSINELSALCVKDALLDTDRDHFVNEIASYFMFKYWNEED